MFGSSIKCNVCYVSDSAILEGQRNVMIGIYNDEVVYMPFSEAIKKDKPPDKSLIKVLDELCI